MEAYQKAPNRVLSIQTTAQGKQTTCFDGAIGWRAFGPRWQPIEGAELEPIKLQADFFRDLKLKGRYQRAVTTGKDKVNGHDVYVVRGVLPGGKFSEQLFFDQQSGLLVRRITLTRTSFGQVPEQQDFDDYRDVNGVRVPFSSRISTPISVVSRTLNEVSFNVPVDDSKFAMPAPAPAGGGPGR